MLRAILGLDRPVRSELVDLVYGLTEGNPFFIEEVLRSLLAAGDLAYTRGTWNWAAPGALRVPRTVHDAVRRRSAQLSGGAREVLEFAAIAGRRFGFELLEALSGRSENDVLTGLKELVAAGLVVEESAELFTFRHALSRQAVLEGLMARERRALHLRVGQTLEDLHGDYVRAGTYFRAALDLARTLGELPSIARSLNRVGNWLANQGEPGQAQAHHSEALSIFRSLDEQAAIAQTLDLLGMASHLEGNASAAVQHWRQAVAAF